jgi:hypothetical protein
MSASNDHVFDQMDDYLHHLLTHSGASHVKSHCADCPTCKAALEEARKRLAALQSLPISEASEEMIQGTMNRIATEEQRRDRQRGYLVAGIAGPIAAAAAIILGFHLYYANLAPSPFDLKVLGQTQLLAGANASLRVFLINRSAKAALAGAPIEITLRHKGTGTAVTLARFTTDAQGTGQPRFQVPEWADGDCDLQVVAQVAGGQESLSRQVQVKRSWQVMLSSDKPVYQPGQTIHVRALALRRPDLRPVAAQRATFTVADPKGNVIFKHQGPTSTYGIASIDCALAVEILEGSYTIACRIGDTESRLTVEVKQYVLPKFKVDVALDRSYYAPGDTLQATVQADYFFGKPVAGGTVDLEVLGTDVGTHALHRSSSQTDSSGKVVFACTLPRSLVVRPQNSGDARISIQASVTDSAGQKQSKAISRVVTTQPLRVEAVPECGTLVKGVSIRVYVFTSYADSRPARSTIDVSLLNKTIRTNELGVGSFDFTSGDGQDVNAVFRATDDRGLSAEKSILLPCGKNTLDFLLRTARAVYNGGETMILTAVGGGQEPVFVDLIKDGQTLLTETIDMADGHGEYHLDLPPELFGTVQLCAYRLNAEGVPVRKTRTLYIRPAGSLEIKTALDQAEYRPGGKARLRLELRDAQGQPARGALSLAAVDEAVFAVLDQAPGMEKHFYMMEQELLQPIYAIYPWSPDLTTSLSPAERDRFELALFARTASLYNDRESFKRKLMPYLENNERIFRALERPDWETYIIHLGFSEEILSVLREGQRPHTLSTATFPEKARQIALSKEARLANVYSAWKVYALTIFTILFIIFLAWLVTIRHWAETIFIVLIVLILIGLFLPATQKVREAAARTQFINDLKQIGLAAANYHDQKGYLPGQAKEQNGSSPTRIRENFPETMLWRPEVITDDDGRANLDIDLADSITTWRLTASAVAADGRLGATQASIRVFQPFFIDVNLPVALTRDDEVAVPVVVYNYLDRPQTVALTLAAAGWFTPLDNATKNVELVPREVRSVSYRLRVKTVGNQELQVTARGSDLSDAIRRTVKVVPDGQRIEQVVNGTLAQTATIDLAVPANVIEGSPLAVVKIYPSSFSQLVEGLDGIFQRPYGCFEQASSTTYPNVLALSYLRQTQRSVPEIEARARQYIHLGYQRLLGFEVSGGGFDWFGRPPANRTLTAYGLMEFQDMAKVHDVDPNLIARTRRWLLDQRRSNGSWEPEGHGLHNDPTGGRGSQDLAKLSTTAYIAWAVFAGQSPGGETDSTRSYLLSHPAGTLNDPHVLALMGNALNALDSSGQDARPYLDRLDGLKKSSVDGKCFFWEQSAGSRTTFYGSGRSGSIETTALAVLALQTHRLYPAAGRGGLAWLVQQKDAGGTWHSTQATVLALKALLAGTGQTFGDSERLIEMVWNGQNRTVRIPADQSEVMRQIELTDELAPGRHRLSLVDRSGTAAGYQVAFRYHVPDLGPPAQAEPLAVDLTYDRTDLHVNETVRATATLVNHMPQAAPMVVLDLPIPAGFVLLGEDLSSLVASGSIARYQVNPRSAVVYLRSLNPGTELKLTYRLRATMPVKVSVPGARAYEYYDADKKGASRATRMTVTAQERPSAPSRK